MVANFKYKIMIYWQDVNIIFDYPINPRKVVMKTQKKVLGAWTRHKQLSWYGQTQWGDKNE